MGGAGRNGTRAEEEESASEAERPLGTVKSGGAGDGWSVENGAEAPQRARGWKGAAGVGLAALEVADKAIGAGLWLGAKGGAWGVKGVSRALKRFDAAVGAAAVEVARRWRAGVNPKP